MRPGPIRPGDGGLLTRWSMDSSSFNEARADSPGRSEDDAVHDSAGTGASMRPGPIRPGDCGRFGDQPVLVPARFNEARADSPGRFPLSVWRAAGVRDCFNEARADSPGR